MRIQGIRPLKGLGQNFLIDKKALERIVGAANLQKKEVVLEIGPGNGNLTRFLAKKAGSVIAVEKDLRLAEILEKNIAVWDAKNIRVVGSDILKINLRNLVSSPYKLVANLPYYITAPVIKKFLESEKQPRLMVLLVQKEVARRVCARVPDMNLLAVSVQFYSKPEIVDYVSKKSFWPQPKVDGAILRILPKKDKEKQVDPNLFFKIVKAGFSHPRKQLVNNLSLLFVNKPKTKVKLEKSAKPAFTKVSVGKEKIFPETKSKIHRWLSNNGILPTQRAETLEIKNWVDLVKTFKNL